MKRERFRGLATGLGVAALAAGVWLATRLLFDLFGGERPERELGAWGTLSLVLTLLLVAWLVLAVHEAGHLLGGRLAGFRALLFIVGPVRLERRPGGWSLGFNRVPALWGGVAASVPTDTRDLARRTLRVIAGGPATSLAAGAVTLALGILTGPPAEATGPPELLSLSLLVFGAGSLAIGIITLFPGRTAGFDTDGARLLRLARGGPVAEGEVAVMALTGLTMAGRRPREWDDELLERALTLEPGSLMGLVARQTAYCHALDSGDVAGAGRHLEEALDDRELLPDFMRPGLLAQGAYFLVVHRGEVSRARELLAEARGSGFGTAHQVSLAKAALCLAEGDAPGALALLERAEEELGRSFDAGLARAEREWIRALKAAAGGRAGGWV